MMSMDELVVRGLRVGYEQLLRPILFGMNSEDPEATHEQLLHLLGGLPNGVLHQLSEVFARQGSPVEVAGIRFPSRVGVAAGLDKDALAARAWGPLGFGFVEFGTVTPVAQPGNPQPRLFRLPHSRAIINRMGFNNAGAPALAARLSQLGVARGNYRLGIPVGISIGKNRTTPLGEALDDYRACLGMLAPFADYLQVNVSSPNTPGLRSLQERSALAGLTSALVSMASDLPDGQPPLPIFVKVSPDLSPGRLADVVEVCQETGVAGIVATNTTLGRPRIHPSETSLAAQAGGLSGAPLTPQALASVQAIARLTDLPIIAVGGIMTPAHAQAMFDAGAALVQVFTGFIYSGVALIAGINRLTTPPTTVQLHAPGRGRR